MAFDQASSGLAAAVAPQSQARDRIVVLGRTQAGKTVYLSALYYSLWKERSEIRVRAMDGPTHKACIEVIDSLKRGVWPSSTIGSRYLNVEVRYKDVWRPLVSLDYPGEVFRKAFIENTTGSDVEELLEHIDRAAGVVILLDPAVVVEQGLMTSMDDDFGMMKAVERIRSWPGGEKVTVVLVLTKYDRRKKLIEAAGGLSVFVRQHYRALVRMCGHVRLFVCSAVQEQNGNEGPKIHPDFRPTGVVAPLRYILESIDGHSKAKVEQEQNERRLATMRDHVEREARRRVQRLWLIVFAVVFGLILLALITWGAWELGSL